MFGWRGSGTFSRILKISQRASKTILAGPRVDGDPITDASAHRKLHGRRRSGGNSHGRSRSFIDDHCDRRRANRSISASGRVRSAIPPEERISGLRPEHQKLAGQAAAPQHSDWGRCRIASQIEKGVPETGKRRRNRLVALATAELAEHHQSEIKRRWPEDQYPFHIEVFETPNLQRLEVHVWNDAVDITRQASPQAFLGSRETTVAAVLHAVERALITAREGEGSERRHEILVFQTAR